MTDREKVIKGLECCKWSRQNVKPEKNKCDECPYKDKSIMNAFAVWRSCTNVLAGDAFILLKEQEPMKPTWSQGKAYCGNCGHGLPRKRAEREINYCSYCGRAVKWE